MAGPAVSFIVAVLRAGTVAVRFFCLTTVDSSDIANLRFDALKACRITRRIRAFHGVQRSLPRRIAVRHYEIGSFAYFFYILYVFASLV